MKINKTETAPAYTFDELYEMRIEIGEAVALWTNKCTEYVKKNGDRGSCVMGAGIFVYVKVPNKRYARELCIISSIEVTPKQGSCIWESSQREIVDFLKSKGVECFFNQGWMD